MDVQVVEVYENYGFVIAEVEPYRTTDYITGKEVEVREFYINGCLYTCEGFRVKKDGDLYAGKSCLSVRIPKNVKEALDAFKA